MPEINHQFTAGRMNKDLDERLVPNGEYRDALNIEVSTSEGSAVGTVQSIWGNKIIGTSGVNDKLRCIGSVTWPKENKVIWFATTNEGETTKADYIYEYDVDNDAVATVFQDVWQVTTSIVGTLNNHVFLSVTDGSSLQPGMVLSVLDPSTGNHIYNNVPVVSVVSTTGGGWLVQLGTACTIPANCTLIFSNEGGRTLGFSPDYLITGVNIIEDLLLWTDNNTEPRKINITRCKYGSLAANLIGNCTSLWVMGQNKGRMLEEHTTMIKKSPLQPPVLTMQKTERGFGDVGGANTETILEYSFIYASGNQAGERLNAGEQSDGAGIPHMTIPSGSPVPVWLEGDTLEFTYYNSLSDFDEKVVVRMIIDAMWVNSSGLTEFKFTLLSISSSIDTTDGSGGPVFFTVKLEEKLPLFRYKFPRFAYRWKYEDGEYSAISPFSEVAFLPEDFDYLPKKGYNLGMVNNIRFLVISKFLPNNDKHTTPLDVVEVDVIYKESNSPNVYTVETIKGPSVANPQLGTITTAADDGWNGLVRKDSNSPLKYFPAGNKTTYPTLAAPALWDKEPEGSLKIESELIHAAVPANQMLRPYDNVPRKALAQELSGNRIIYGNYLQQYNLVSNNGAHVTPKFQISLSKRRHNYGEFGGELPVQYSESLDSYSQYGILAPSGPWNWVTSEAKKPEKSIKSIRKYQIGVVFMDKYGRQTPILTDSSGTIQVEKSEAPSYNSLTVRLDDGSNIAPNTPEYPDWATHYKYYIKETSNEYYNLAMDRFYDAEDGNVWMSFPSSERNKVQEDTFLILKKQHDNDTFVKDEARYKILAIENEAPTFVKTQQRTMGSAVTNFGSAGEPKPDNLHVDIPGASSGGFWDNNWGENFGKGDDPDVLVFRVKRDDNFSKWYTVAGRSTVSNHVRIKSTKPFGEDMAFTIVDPTAVIPTFHTNLEFELAEQVVTQLPEFEGRFFVKIYRDITLEKNILAHQPQPRFSPTMIKQIKRLYRRSTTESGHKSCFDGYRGWFLDEASCMGWSGGCSKSSNCGGHLPDGANTIFTGSISNNWSHVYDLSDVNGPGGLGGMHPTGAGLFNSGKHGLSNSSVIADSMHLSWTKINPRDNDGIWRPNHSGASVYNAEKDFANAMSTTGTRFRFAGDTNVYEIVGSPDGGTNPKTIKIENYDNQDQNDYWDNDWDEYDDAHNKRWRISLRFDPPIPTQNGTTGPLPGGETQVLTNYDPRKDLVLGDGNSWDRSCKKSGAETRTIEIVEVAYDESGDFTSDNPAIWETEPKEDVGLDLYYEASGAFPIGPGNYYLGSWNPLFWYNCYSYANGVESQRIRDDFNAVQIDKSPKVSMPLAEQYMEERKWSGLIFSGIFNSTSGVNRLNQFIQAEAITKDLQPAYGSIQKLHSRSTADGDLIALCEDKVLKVLANKDALYNADGNTNVTANTNVLGQAIPYSGEFGISRNPESFAYDSYRAYFTDKDRGVVMRLSQDGLTPISDIGMRDWFHDTFKEQLNTITGSWDERKGMYHVSIDKKIQTSDTSNFVPPSGTPGFMWGIAGNGGRGLFFQPGTGYPGWQAGAAYWDIDEALDMGDIAFYDINGDYVTSPGDVHHIAWSGTDGNGNAYNAAPSSGNNAIWFNHVWSHVGSNTVAHYAALNQKVYWELREAGNPNGEVAVFEAIGTNSNNNGAERVYWAGGQAADTYHPGGMAFVFAKVKHVYGSLDLHHHQIISRMWVGDVDPIWNRTVSYSERVGGWVSFKSWMQESGCSINNKFYTFKGGKMWEHYVGDTIATYYPGSTHEIYEEPSVTVLLNDQPASVKTYSTLNYEGSQQKITQNVNPLNKQYYNLASQDGWYCSSFITNLETGFLNEFIEKEGKYFNFLKDNKENTLANLDEEQFNTQGIGRTSSTSGGSQAFANITVEDVGDQD